MKTPSGLTSIVIPAIAGLLVILLFFPLSRVDIVPVQCASVIGMDVPCESPISVVAGAGVALLLALLVRFRSKRIEQ